MIDKAISQSQRIVIKTGSALVADGLTGRPRDNWLQNIAAEISALRAAGKQIVLVTSGAIALGWPALGQGQRPRKLEDKQAAAALGQPKLMRALDDVFNRHDLMIAQALLTVDDTERRRRWLNARSTLEVLLTRGVIPVINENDTVATDEIRYGDNDRLAARVSQMIGADLLILLSDVDGLYTDDPRKSGTAEHISFVDALTDELMSLGGEANAIANMGSGGMATKLAAVEIAFAAGCQVIIAKGNRDKPVSDLLSGQAKATLFDPKTNPQSARKSWLAGTLNPDGTLYVDAGAAKAVLGGASLLPVGVKRVEGQFERGAAVDVVDPDGHKIATGITAYSSGDAGQICGLHSNDIDQVLGQPSRTTLIHRDDLVIKER